MDLWDNHTLAFLVWSCEIIIHECLLGGRNLVAAGQSSLSMLVER